MLFYAAILTAAVATFGVYRSLEAAREKNQVPTRAVVVASKDLPEGAVLSGSTIEARDYPIGTIPEGAYMSTDSLMGRVTRVPVFAGEAIVPGRLAPLGTGPGLEVKIAAGHRAMAVRIDDVAGISGLLQPNSRVDVLVTIRDNAANRQTPVAKLFMENMRVLSVGTTVDRDVDGKPIKATSVTLEVTPDEAERLAVAAHEGSIQLVLRGFGDPASVKTTGARTSDVLEQMSRARPAAPPAEPGPRVRPPRKVDSAPPPVMPPVAPVVLPVPVIMPPPAPPKPESVTVTIHRGDKIEILKFPRRDSVIKP